MRINKPKQGNLNLTNNSLIYSVAGYLAIKIIYIFFDCPSNSIPQLSITHMGYFFINKLIAVYL